MSVLLEWEERAPVAERPDLRVWTSLLPEEHERLRELAAGRAAMEIGSGFGFSTLTIASVATHLWSIDRHDIAPGWGNFFHGAPLPGYEAGTRAKVEENLRRAGLEAKVTILEGMSAAVIAPGSSWAFQLSMAGVRLAFVDGDHSVQGCLTDVANCERILRANGGGWLAVHDYDERGNDGVRRALDPWLAGRPMELVGTLAVVEI